jgi:cytochrome c oxidase cbb3-type subunit 4
MSNHSLYDTLRNLADSWGLLVMAASFLLLAAWPFRPGAQEANRAAANLIFDEDDDHV